jgi:hypothetical protein
MKSFKRLAYSILYNISLPRPKRTFKSSWAKLYYISYTNKKLGYKIYKLGFTQRRIEERLREISLPDFNMEVISLLYINNPSFAYALEQYLHGENRKYNYKSGLLLAPGNGNGEIYDRDILSLDDGRRKEEKMFLK